MSYPCPSCKRVGKNWVLDTRPLRRRGTQFGCMRRRECECGHRWTTHELDRSTLRLFRPSITPPGQHV